MMRGLAIIWAAVLCLGLFSESAAPAAKGESMAGTWQPVDQLVAEQKFQEALVASEKLLAQAEAKNDPDEWTRALIRVTQLRRGLASNETAVKGLRDAKWPAGLKAKSLLTLYYAHTIVSYLQMYGYEIDQREAVDTKGKVDLKTMTRAQLWNEAARAYDQVWQQRESLGSIDVATWKEFIEPNDYPRGIRGTMRDALSYFAVDLLEDTGNWRPEDANEAFRLDFPALMAGPARPSTLHLNDAAQHPLVRVTAVLGDLEAWHAAKGGKEGALEARLGRVRRLLVTFSAADQRDRAAKYLDGLLPAYRAVPWWATGIADRAGLAQQKGELALARRIALEGAKAYPESLGGRRCTTLVKSIEAPDYQLRAMTTDAPGKRSILVTHKNLKKVYFRAYRMNLVEQVEGGRDYEVLPGARAWAQLKAQKPAFSWDSALPATPDYELHKTYVTPPMKELGLYYVVASATPAFTSAENRVVATDLVLSDLVVTSRIERGAELGVTVVSGKDGKPVPGVEVRLYRFEYGKKNTPRDKATTDAKGQARFKAKKAEYNAYFIVARKGGDTSIDPQQQYFYPESPEPETKASFIYTDRSIYRPLQTLHWKVLAYNGSRQKAAFKTAAGQKILVTLLDANRQKIAEASVKTDEFGSASGSFSLPAGHVLGAWALSASYGNGSASVRVEEYKRPTFEVTLKDPEAPLRMNRDAALKGEAKYYFGLPVTSGAVRWRVTRQPVYPSWWGWFFWRGGGEGSGQAQTVATGTAKLDDDGSFKIAFKPEAEETKDSAGLTYRYAVSADLTDDGGETRSTARTFRVGFVSVEATIALSHEFLSAEKEPGEATVQRTSLDGIGKAGKATWRVLALKQPAATLTPAELPVPNPEKPGVLRTDGDRRRERWAPAYDPHAELARWADGAELAHGALTHDAKGAAALKLPKLAPGAYRIRYETADDFGAIFKTFKDVIVAGPDAVPLNLPAYFAAEAASVTVGGTARFLVHSGLKGQTILFDVFRDGRLTERRTLTGGKGAVIAIPVKEGDRGGFGVAVTIVTDHQLLQYSQAVFVPWDDKELELGFSTFRDKLRPGTKETWRVTVKGATGLAAQKGAAELLAYMYDKSLDTFAPHAAPAPLSIYPDRSDVNWSRTNLGAAYTFSLEEDHLATIPGYTTPHGDVLQFLDGYATLGPGGRSHRRYGAMPMAEKASAPMQLAGSANMKSAASRSRGVAKDREADKDGFSAQAAREEPAGGGGGKKATEAPGADAQKPPEVRSNFSETAFFQPRLLTDDKGEAAIEFTVPDSVTAWNVWVHAITKDMHAGSLHKEARSVKELMVRPYMPRFFREGDEAALKVVVNNAGTKDLEGTVELEIIDPESGESRAALFGVEAKSLAFRVAKGKGADLTFPLVAPNQVGIYAFRVTAKSGAVSDGELRPLPVLPSRMHLAQSRFVALRDKDSRTLSFDDLAKGGDPTRIDEKLVVTVDGQLFYSVLKSLPYLINYPYECTEQTLNRFLATGIVASVFAQFPAVATMTRELAKRDTPLETEGAIDPNRKMTLEESPWLEEAKGGRQPDLPVLKVLDPKVAKAERESALAKLRKAQYGDGSFPWFPGGPPSEYMTLYLMHGFAKATEFGALVPKDMVTRAWGWLAGQFRKNHVQEMIATDCCWEYLTFLNYVASAYPDASWTGDALKPAEREAILAHSWKHWKQHSPYLKAYLALTLKRMKRGADAKLVMDSIMDSAKSDKDLGTYWQPEDRSWLWYNDTIESHAFILRALGEVEPGHPKEGGLVSWLFLNKKLNHWKSTKATAEVIYSLVHYLKKAGALGTKEEAKVTVGGIAKTFTFAPDVYTGKAQLVVEHADIKPKEMADIKVTKETKGVLFASATWHFSTDQLPKEARGDFFTVERRYFLRDTSGKGATLKPLADGAELSPGDQVEVQLALTAKHEAEYVHLRDPRAAGLEPENAVSRYKWDLGLAYYEEFRDSGSNFFFEHLPAGQYTFKYRLRANMRGKFRVGPATVESMYAPEFTAYSAGDVLTVK